MLVEIRSEEDLPSLENAIVAMLGAQRLDVSVLRSKPYIELRQHIMKRLNGETHSMCYNSTYFANEDLVLRILSHSPILVWCDKKDVIASSAGDDV
jgi:hypothetical protein